MGVMEMGVQEFLDHEARARGGSYLKNWKDPKKGGKGYLHFWLHRKCAFSVAIWRHSIPRIDIIEDQRTGESRRVVLTSQELCPEDEKVLQKQNWRDRDTGGRQLPPESCPVCLLMEHVRGLVDSGELSLSTPVFVFDPGGSSRDADQRGAQVIHAGGLCGMFNDRLSDEQKASLKAEGIWMTEAWKENWAARLNYVFRGVDNEAPASGVQIAIEPSLLGDKMKAEIRKAMMPGVWGPERGNPIKNPYAFRWEAHPEQPEFHKKYDVVRMEGLQLTPEIEKLITDTDPPSIDGVTRSPQWATIQAHLERAAQIDLPWDDFFGTDVVNEDKKESPRARTPEVRTDPVGVATAKAFGVQTTSHKVQIPKGSTLGKELVKKMQEPEVERFACDNEQCDAVLLATDDVCGKCGMRYNVQAAPPPPPSLPKRSSAKAFAPSQAKAPSPPKAAPIPEPWMDDVDNGEIPF